MMRSRLVLPRPLRPAQPDHLAGLHLQVQPVKQQPFTTLAAQGGGSQHGRALRKGSIGAPGGWNGFGWVLTSIGMQVIERSAARQARPPRAGGPRQHPVRPGCALGLTRRRSKRSRQYCHPASAACAAASRAMGTRKGEQLT
jgi:hypothetical protein